MLKGCNIISQSVSSEIGNRQWFGSHYRTTQCQIQTKTGDVNLWANKSKHNLMRIHIDLRTMQETARRQRLVKKIRQYRTTGEHHSEKKPKNPL